jgi:hypothetical protein
MGVVDILFVGQLQNQDTAALDRFALLVKGIGYFVDRYTAPGSRV